LAAGTGLAPILALAEAALRRGFKKPVAMVFSARTRADVYSQGMMAWWRTKHRNFDYKVTLTREQAEGYLAGRIDVVLPQLFPDLSKHTIFAAGSPEFVETCVATVKKLGAQDALIHTEGFFAQQQPVVADADHLLPA
jgi:CDP-4-dehydro-6-deoxyglucose reductase